MRFTNSLSKLLHRLIDFHSIDIEASPLLSQTQLEYIMTRVESLPNIRDTQKQTDRHYLGQVGSRERGPGSDFIENRDYHFGDNPRAINWRASARHDRLQTRVYQKECRPDLLIMMDRRSSMRFGTINQLKITQAAGLAFALAAYFLMHNRSVTVLTLEQTLSGGETVSRMRDLHALLTLINAPAPIVTSATSQVSLAVALHHLAARFELGNKLVLLSDFFDLDDSCQGVLSELARMHRLLPLQILDASEVSPDFDLNYDVHGVRDEYICKMRDLSLTKNQEVMSNHLLETAARLSRCSQNVAYRLPAELDLFGDDPEARRVLLQILESL